MLSAYRPTKFACYIGYIVQAIINNFLPILFIVFQTNYAITYEQLGRIIFINFFTQLIVDLLTPSIVKFTGYRGAVILCHALAAVGLCMLGILPLFFDNIYICLVISIVVYATGSGIIEVVLSPLMELLPSKNNETDMAIMHSFYCWGQAFTVLVTTALVIGFGYSSWHYIPIIWAIIPFANMLFFTKVLIIEPEGKQRSETAKSLFLTRDFWCLAILMVCAGASEITMSEWASVFAQNGLGVDKFTGDLLGPCAFAIFMGIGRIIFGLQAGKFSPRKALIINSILCFVCYILVAFCNIAFISLIACAFCGFTVSLSWPETYSMAARRFPSGGTLMFSIFALCGDFGCSSGPWLLGFIADKLSLQYGFLSAALFPILAAFTAVFVLKEKD